MDLLYLDYNCFQRGFDDPGQVRIRMEALACQEIFIKAERSEVQLVWSFMHKMKLPYAPFPLENTKPFALRRYAKKGWVQKKKYINLRGHFKTAAALVPKMPFIWPVRLKARLIIF